MKLRIVLLSFLMAFTQLSFAQMPPKPDSCPSASALQGVPFIFAQKPDEAPGFMAIAMPSNYGTNDTWGFLMGFIDAKDAFEAVMTANQHLGGVYGDPEPFPVEDQNVWICGYGVKDTPYQAIAVTPLSGGIQSLKVGSLLKRAHA
jgi:hypothetical protein